MFQALNPLEVPISHTNLIEASAGTGKTWNIAALFTRLILLEHYHINTILVVTFTKAATAELKTRLRIRLDETLNILNRTPDAANHFELLKQNCHSNGKLDEFLLNLIQQALQKEDQARLQLRLKAAISEFDNAAIYTIHGFCQRVLQDFAFLCQVPFDIQLDEQSAENQQIIAAQDFWRTQVATQPHLANLVHRHRLTPENQLFELKSFISRPYLPFRQPEHQYDYTQTLADFQAAWQNIQSEINQIEADFWAIQPLLDGRNFSKKSFAKKFDWLKENVRFELPDLANLRKTLENSSQNIPFHYDFIDEKIKKQRPDENKIRNVAKLGELADLTDYLIAAEQNVLHQLSCDFTNYLRQYRQEQKKHSPQRVFDDLLLDVHHALLNNPEYSQSLVDSLAQNWHVALIDEFQDTDPLQYAIFRTAFAQTNTPLFLVGDPKQAIYGFRGADIFSYLQAVKDSEYHYTLNTNHRSHKKLMDSISSLFQREQAFALPEITYTPIQAHRQQSDLSDNLSSVQIRWLSNHDGENQDKLVKQSAAICAQQIADLLAQSAQGSLKINDENVHAGQIAILVRAHKDGAVAQRELKRLGIQSVLLSKANIFAEPEAQAVAALLEFVIQPQKLGLLRFVLSSCLFKYDSADLQDLNIHENKLLTWIDSANQTLEVWHQFGIYSALQQFFTRHQVETHLLAQKNERSLTNLHQIMELLAQEDELSHTPTSLHQWLNQEIQAALKNNSITAEHQVLRLESDENLVKIVTMHAAKGLEYPIVFCPFAWKKSNDSSRQQWYISHKNGEAQIISKNQYKQSNADKLSIQQENLSEDLRLLYVALTRARERLYVYVSHFQSSEQPKKSAENEGQFINALAYLLNADKNLTQDATAYENHWRNFIAQNNQNGADFEFIVHHDTHHSSNLKKQQNADLPNYQAKSFQNRHFQFIQHASFTSLSRQTQRATELLLPALDSDELQMTALPTTPPDGDSIHAFPQGAAAGVCLHTILERLDFRQPAAKQIDWIDKKLNEARFDANIWRDAVVQMCDFARETPLLARVNLASLNPRNYLSEMTFLIHTTHFRLADIQAWFAAQKNKLPERIIQAAQQLNFYDVRGFLNGAVDLVAQTPDNNILIIDYKSNYLGNSATAYTPHAINDAMAEHHYYFQAFIYAIAVARYLKSRDRLPEKIAVRYLFLRGLDGITDNGVWAWDIDVADLIKWI